MVAVHAVVTATNRGDSAGADLFHDSLELADKPRATVRGRVTTVGKSLHENACQFVAGGHFNQRVKMAGVAVNPVWRDQANQMKCVLVALTPFHRLDERRFLEEIAVSDALIDARQILINDAAGAHRDVSDLGVAHLTGRQADELAGRLKR